MGRVDVVVVTYNSRDEIRDCVSPLAADPTLNVIVVDNASGDGTPEVIQDLELTVIRNPGNRGFGSACNTGWAAGSAPFVLFLNPDARVDPASIHELADSLANDERAGIVGPQIRNADGTIQASQRRFPSHAASFAHAFFLHRVLPRTRLSFDISNPREYESVRHPDWVSGACLLIRRELLELVGGFDERFFMYCEDMDICRQARSAGLAVRYEPSVVVQHAGAASAPRAHMVATMIRSRLLYARKHRTWLGYQVERLAIALDSLTHALVTTQGPEARRLYLNSLRAALTKP